MLAFLLDIIEVPESHTGTALAKAFQKMLETFGLQDCILAVNADNGSANDMQTKALTTMENSFDGQNRVRCFNHTLHLSAKALLSPFNAA